MSPSHARSPSWRRALPLSAKRLARHMDRAGEGRGAGAARFERFKEVSAAGPMRRHPVRAMLALIATGVLVAAGLIGGVASPALAATCSPNPVACENAKTGTSPSVWDIDG